MGQGLPPRYEALQRLHLLEGPPPGDVDRLVRLASYLADGSAAAVHLVDEDSQHRVAAVGAPLVRTAAADSMCLQAVESGEVVYTPDATLEPRFAGSPYVTGQDPVRMYFAAPLRDSRGTALGTLCVFDGRAHELGEQQRALLTDLAAATATSLELHGLVGSLAHAATHDPLTGLPNRLLFGDRLAGALARSLRRPGEPLLVLVDLDRFKAVNDEHGHLAGDEVLREVAARLRRSVRKADSAARFGGDEFVVLFEEVPSPASAAHLAGRLRQDLAPPYLLRPGSSARGADEVMCEASLGDALAVPGELAYELLGRADLRLYEDKRRRAARPG